MKIFPLMRSSLCLACLAALVAGVASCDAPIERITGRVVQDTLASVAADETFDILVRLPPDYDAEPAQRYPVLYQLDATWFDQFARTAGMISRLATEGAAPETIVVGIGHRTDQGPERNRFVDFVVADPYDPARPGRAAEFYRFLHNELAPRIEAAYRTDPDAGRALVGHSLGGAMALYATFQREEDGSPAFRNVLAADPPYGINDGVLFGAEATLAAAARSRPGRLHLSAAVYTTAAQKFPHKEMARRLARDFPDLQLRTLYAETTHEGIIQISLDDGLAFVLRGGP